MTEDWSVYALLDEDSSIRYIGRSRDVYKRLQSHWDRRKSKHEPLHFWLRTLSKKPQVRVLSSHPQATAHQSEMLWIRVLRQQPFACGLGLLNLRPDHTFKLSPGARAKTLNAHRGHKHSPETRAKLSEAGRSPENIARLTEMARNRSPETRQKISDAHKRRRERKEGGDSG
jgi:hypothetical protein